MVENVEDKPDSEGIIQFAILNPHLLQQKDELGRTPLHWASIAGTPEDLATLLALDNTKINDLDLKGHTPLHFAIIHNNLDKIKMLLNDGADLNLIDLEKTVSHDLALFNYLSKIKNKKSIDKNSPDYPEVRDYQNRSVWLKVFTWFIQHPQYLKNEKVYQLYWDEENRKTIIVAEQLDNNLLTLQINYINKGQFENQTIAEDNFQEICAAITHYLKRKQPVMSTSNTNIFMQFKENLKNILASFPFAKQKDHKKTKAFSSTALFARKLAKPTTDNDLEEITNLYQKTNLDVQHLYAEINKIITSNDENPEASIRQIKDFLRREQTKIDNLKMVDKKTHFLQNKSIATLFQPIEKRIQQAMQLAEDLEKDKKGD